MNRKRHRLGNSIGATPEIAICNARDRLHERAWQWRGRMLVVCVVTIGLVAAIMVIGGDVIVRRAVTIGVPVICLSWALYALPTWFHPRYGGLAVKSRWLSKLPVWLRHVLRGYAALYLVLFVALWITFLAIALVTVVASLDR